MTVFVTQLAVQLSSDYNLGKFFNIKELQNWKLEIGNNWKFHIDTLSPYYGVNPGIHVMTAVKKISVTDNFLKLPMKNRKCMDDVYEECKATNLLSKGQQNSD